MALSKPTLLDLHNILQYGTVEQLQQMLREGCPLDDEKYFIDMILFDLSSFTKEKWDVLFASGLWEKTKKNPNLFRAIISDVIEKDAMLSLNAVQTLQFFRKNEVSIHRENVFNYLVNSYLKISDEKQKQQYCKVIEHLIDCEQDCCSEHNILNIISLTAKRIDDPILSASMQKCLSQTTCNVLPLQSICRTYLRFHFIECKGNVFAALEQTKHILPANVCSYLIFN